MTLDPKHTNPTTADTLAARRYPDALREIERLRARVEELERNNKKLRHLADNLFSGFVEALTAFGASEETIERVKAVTAAALAQAGEETR